MWAHESAQRLHLGCFCAFSSTCPSFSSEAACVLWLSCIFHLSPSFLLLFSLLFQASYASSDLYSLNGLSTSRNTSSAFNGYQVCIQTVCVWVFSLRVCGGGKEVFKFLILCFSCVARSVPSPSSSIVGLVSRWFPVTFLTVLNTGILTHTSKTKLVCYWNQELMNNSLFEFNLSQLTSCYGRRVCSDHDTQ